MSIIHAGKTYRIMKSKDRFTWDESKDSILKYHFDQKDSRAKIASLLDCAISTVHRRLFVLNIDGSFWDAQKDGIIKADYMTRTNEQLAAVLKCQSYHVADRLAYVSLTRPVGRKKNPVKPQ